VGTFTDREQDGQKPLKMNTIAADHVCTSPSFSQLASIHGD
jgi:hypothetical protein